MTTTVSSTTVQVDNIANAAGTGAPTFTQGVTLTAAKALKADTINNAAGTGAPDFTTGLKISTGTTLLTYSETSIDLGSTDAAVFTSGTLTLIKIGRIVTLQADNVDPNASAQTYTTAAGRIPAAYRPQANVEQITSHSATGGGSRVYEMQVITDGTWVIDIRTATDLGTLATTTGNAVGRSLVCTYITAT